MAELSRENLNVEVVSLNDQQAVDKVINSKESAHENKVVFSPKIIREINNGNPQKVVISKNDETHILACAESSKTAVEIAKGRSVYYLFKGDTVKDTIERWARENGYSIIWDVKINFDVQQDATLYGDFLASDGPFLTLLSSLKQTNTPIKAVVMKNNTIVIRPDSFSSNFLMPTASTK
ncbi:TcpQ domain-containing protein [Cysteiniphilum sp. SYW-8]|nr:TcpQ domain-containing protein [Cysteiniphilum sp. SYW-8]